jgi:predicted dehydrogenase
MPDLVGVAILGACGWMGKCHSLGYRNLPLLFPQYAAAADIRWIVDSDPERLDAVSGAYPGARTSTDWRKVLEDPDVALVDICLPDNLHFQVAREALLAGKHVYCEKPFTATAEEARELADLAEARGLVTRVGHNFPKNPVHELTREMIEGGEIGELVLFRASMHVDVLADPDTPFMWRCDGDLAPTGVVGDVASHVFSFVDMLVGPVARLVADVATTVTRRAVVDGFGYGVQATRPEHAQMRTVTNSDLVTLLCEFESGGRGVIDVSRVASGRRFRQTYEIYGTKGSIAFDYDQINRLRVYSSRDDPQTPGLSEHRRGAGTRKLCSLPAGGEFRTGLQRIQGDRGRRGGSFGRPRGTKLADVPRRLQHHADRRCLLQLVRAARMGQCGMMAGAVADSPSRRPQQDDGRRP